MNRKYRASSSLRADGCNQAFPQGKGRRCKICAVCDDSADTDRLRGRRYGFTTGFTLIELLVVIAIFQKQTLTLRAF